MVATNEARQPSVTTGQNIQYGPRFMFHQKTNSAIDDVPCYIPPLCLVMITNDATVSAFVWSLAIAENKISTVTGRDVFHFPNKDDDENNKDTIRNAERLAPETTRASQARRPR